MSRVFEIRQEQPSPTKAAQILRGEGIQVSGYDVGHMWRNADRKERLGQESP